MTEWWMCKSSLKEAGKRKEGINIYMKLQRSIKKQKSVHGKSEGRLKENESLRMKNKAWQVSSRLQQT